MVAERDIFAYDSHDDLGYHLVNQNRNMAYDPVSGYRFYTESTGLSISVYRVLGIDDTTKELIYNGTSGGTHYANLTKLINGTLYIAWAWSSAGMKVDSAICTNYAAATPTFTNMTTPYQNGGSTPQAYSTLFDIFEIGGVGYFVAPHNTSSWIKVVQIASPHTERNLDTTGGKNYYYREIYPHKVIDNKWYFVAYESNSGRFHYVYWTTSGNTTVNSNMGSISRSAFSYSQSQYYNIVNDTEVLVDRNFLRFRSVGTSTWTELEQAISQSIPVGPVFEDDGETWDKIIWNYIIWQISAKGYVYTIQPFPYPYYWGNGGYLGTYADSLGTGDNYETWIFSTEVLDAKSARITYPYLDTPTCKLISAKTDLLLPDEFVVLKSNDEIYYQGKVSRPIYNNGIWEYIIKSPIEEDLNRPIKVAFVQQKKSEILRFIIDNYCLYLRYTDLSIPTTDTALYDIVFDSNLKQVMLWITKSCQQFIYWNPEFLVYLNNGLNDNGIDLTNDNISKISVRPQTELYAIIIVQGGIDPDTGRPFESIKQNPNVDIGGILLDVKSTLNSKALVDEHAESLIELGVSMERIIVDALDTGFVQFGEQSDFQFINSDENQTYPISAKYYVLYTEFELVQLNTKAIISDKMYFPVDVNNEDTPVSNKELIIQTSEKTFNIAKALEDVVEPTGYLLGLEPVMSMVSDDFTLTGPLVFYSSGVKYTKTGDQTEDLSGYSTYDIIYIYFDENHELYSSLSPWQFGMDHVFTAIVYKQASNYIIFDERHLTMGWANHRTEHLGGGPRWGYGFDATFSSTQVITTEGVYFDEDIMHVIPAGSPRTVKVVYSSAAGHINWIVDNASTLWYKMPVATVQYDNNGTLTNLSTNKYCCMYCYTSPDKDKTPYMIVGQTEHNLPAQAEAENPNTLVLPEFMIEFKLAYKVIVKHDGTYYSTTDYRDPGRGEGGAPVITSHTSLGDRFVGIQHNLSNIGIDQSLSMPDTYVINAATYAANSFLNLHDDSGYSNSVTLASIAAATIIIDSNNSDSGEMLRLMKANPLPASATLITSIDLLGNIVSIGGLTLGGNVLIENASTPTLTIGTTATSSQEGQVYIRGARTTSTTSDIAQIFLQDGSLGSSLIKTLGKITIRKETGSTYQGNLIFWTNNGADTFIEGLRLDKSGNALFGNHVYIAADKHIKFLDFTETSVSSGQWSGISGTFLVGESVTFGDVCYMSSTGMKKANANNAADLPAIGIALASYSATQDGVFLIQGVYYEPDNTGITAGEPVYVGLTDGQADDFRPTASGDYIQRIGIGVGTRIVYFNPSLDVVGIP